MANKLPGVEMGTVLLVVVPESEGRADTEDDAKGVGKGKRCCL